MLGCVLVLVAAVSVRASLSEASVADTLQHLKEWELHGYFADEFEAYGYNGRFLQALDINDYDPQRFPSATRAHWKILLENIKMAQEQHASRKLEEKKGKAGIGTDGKEKSDSDGKGNSGPLSDTKDFKGLRIKADKAFVTFGVNEDVKLIRTAAKKLSLTGALSVESLSSKTITVDGKPVGGGDAALKKRVEDLESALSTVWDGLKCSGNGEYDAKSTKCTCDEGFTGSDCAVDKKKMYAHPMGKGKSPCEILAENGDKSDGVKKIFLDGAEKTIYCEGGWMKVFSIGCLRKCNENNMFGNTGAVNAGDCQTKNHKSGNSCKYSDADINKYVGARGYKLQVWGSPMSGYRAPRYIKASCNFRSDQQPNSDCSKSWANLQHSAGGTTGTHSGARGLNVKLQDCITHNLASLNYAGRKACFQSCGHHCQDASCHKGEGCNQAVFV